jgi:hypothetical protein
MMVAVFGLGLNVIALVQFLRAGDHSWVGWCISGMALVIVGALVVAYKAVGEAEQARATAAALPQLSPNPATILTWDGTDYQPQAAKQWRGPKEFIGPVNPDTVPGVITNEHDKWSGYQE